MFFLSSVFPHGNITSILRIFLEHATFHKNEKIVGEKKNREISTEKKVAFLKRILLKISAIEDYNNLLFLIFAQK